MIARTGFFVLCSVFKELVRSARAEGNRRPGSSARTRCSEVLGASGLPISRPVDRVVVPRTDREPRPPVDVVPVCDPHRGVVEFEALLAPGSHGPPPKEMAAEADWNHTGPVGPLASRRPVHRPPGRPGRVTVAGRSSACHLGGRELGHTGRRRCRDLRCAGARRAASSPDAPSPTGRRRSPSGPARDPRSPVRR